MDDDKRGMRKNLTSYGDAEFSLFLRKAFIKAMGYSEDALDRPIVGITNTFSGFNACHRNVPEILDAVKRGVLLTGGLPIEFPTISIHESFSHPTSMFLRNLMAIATEEMIRAQPMDSVVLIGGCDKTVPALLMGAASANVPAIVEVTGPMVTGAYRGERVGSCTDCRRLWGKYRSDEIDEVEIGEANNELAPSAGFCNVMGTASTMACLAEGLGMMLPGGAAIPAVYSQRLRHAEATGARAVELARENLTPDKIMTAEAFENALRVLLAIGGSTNGVIHLAAVAGRLRIELDLDGMDRMGRNTPTLVDLKPNGKHFMEDFYRAGGLTTVLREIQPLLNTDCVTVTGKTLGEVIASAPPSWPQTIVRKLDDPIYPEGGIAVLRGNLAPNGAIIKQSAASAALIRHEGPAVVFDSIEDLMRRIDDPDLDVGPDSVLVLRNAGPRGAPGMPEAGYIPIPRKLARDGVKDMVRISDARMSGTAFGTIVLHVSPEAAAGGPLALVRTGDSIRLDVPSRQIELLVAPAELDRRREERRADPSIATRGYRKLYVETVQQAEKGCDFDFLVEPPTRITPRQP